ncbi:MAG: hypothetical protein JWR69_2413, partial [Pedosphaera sp.]|nr:hypothetical protein [Pedosphaera sp.]
MTTNLFYNVWDGKVGGPMVLGEEYRWNVPIVTYGFDKSFLDYFGQPGVDAVEAAIQTINDLPPASSIALTNYPLNTTGYNREAGAQRFFDLKSATLPMLLQQFGLTSPSANVWALRRWDSNICLFILFVDSNGMGFIPEGMFDFLGPYYVDQRNFDPITLQASRYVNETPYTYLITTLPDCTAGYIQSLKVDPLAPSDTAVCDNGVLLNYGGGLFYTGLTADDVGGLLYLHNRTNINVETLDASIFPDNHTTNNLLRTAPRPGVEKITFVQHTTNFSGDFLTMTNQFTDAYFTNNAQVTQAVQRVTSQPDFLFSAKDIGFVTYNDGANPGISLRFCQPPDTSGWINNSGLNGNLGGDGPGVIRPQVRITFPTPAKYIAAAGGAINGPAYLW